MTKKDYELIAGALAKVRPAFDRTERRQAWDWCVFQMVSDLKAANQKFDANKFVTACGHQQLQAGQWIEVVDINA